MVGAKRERCKGGGVAGKKKGKERDTFKSTREEMCRKVEYCCHFGSSREAAIADADLTSLSAMLSLLICFVSCTASYHQETTVIHLKQKKISLIAH